MRHAVVLGRLISQGSRVGLLAALLLLATGATPARAATNLDLPTIRAMADKSDPEAQNTLGNAYTNSLFGLRQDYGEALKWYRRAADQGFAPAQFNLGLTYELGRGVPVDEQEAFKQYLRAAEQGFGAALFNVGNMYAAGRGVGQDHTEANVWYRQAADQGLVEAQYNLGLAYEAGRGVKQDLTQAARWYRQAAERGFPLALYNLALLFEDGRGVEPDPAAAAGLYRAAAAQGVALAQNNYGLMIFEGRGGQARDPVEALAWITLAVENGVAPAARETVAQTLTTEQKAAAAQRAGDLRRQLAAQSAPAAPAVAAAEPAPTAPLPGTPPKTRAARADDQPVTFKSKFAAQDELGPEAQVAILRKENARLNDELTRASREVVWLNQQQRASQAADAAAATAEKNSRTLATQLEEARAENTRLTAELGRIRSNRASADAADQIRQLNKVIVDLTGQLQQARSRGLPAGGDNQAVAQLQQQVQALLREKAEFEKWAAMMEKAVRDKAAAPATPTEAGQPDEKLAQAQQQLAVSTTALEAELRRATKLAAENRSLTDRVQRAEELLATQGGPTEDLQRQLLESRQLAARLSLERESLGNILAQEQAAHRETQARLTGLEQSAGRSEEAASAQTRVADLERQLAEAHASGTGSNAQAARIEQADRAVEQLTNTVAELTAANQKLQEQLTSRPAGTSLPPAPTGTLEARVHTLEQERDQLVSQLERTRETNRALSTANRQLLTSGLRPNDTGAAQAAGDPDAAAARVSALTTQLARAQQDLDAEQKRSAELATELASSRLAQATRAPDQNGQKEQAVLTARLAQLQRELEAARTLQNRQAAETANREREQAAIIAQLRTANGALSSRLSQTQGTLDQIATSVRLSVPGASPAAAQPVAAQPVYHQVADGDSLSKISLRYYGTAGRWQEIYQANSSILQGSNALRVGQQLRIP